MKKDIKILEDKLIKLGFVDLETEESFRRFGILFWDVYYCEYGAEIEPVVWERKPFETFYTEGLTKVIELPVGGFYTEVYRAVWYKVYLVHIATGHKKYWRVRIYDKEKLGQVAQTEVSEGFIFLGSQKDLEDVLPELIKMLDPAKIKIY